MKIGIIVIFMISDENEKLLEIHLEKIRKHTTVPYRIYGAANRLQEHFMHHVTDSPDITICDIPTAHDFRSKKEHSYYLEWLVSAAIADGVTHVVTLHVDSFPVKDGWASEIESLLDGDVELVSINGPFTSCLYFSSEYYREYHPTFLLSEDTLASQEYEEFARSFVHIIPHSGIGYIYKTHQIKKRVHYLSSTNNRVFGGCLYHFGGAILKSVKAERHHGSVKTAVLAVERGLIAAAQQMRKISPSFVTNAITKTGVRKRVRKSEMTNLLDDPEGYLARLIP